MTDPGLTPAQARKRIGRAFEWAGYAVERVVDEPRTVVNVARARKEPGAPGTVWVVWSTCPGHLQSAVDGLEAMRGRHGCKRALGVVARGDLPADYCTDLDGRPVNIITLRRLLLELSGVADEMRALAQQSANDPGLLDDFLPRQLVTSDGDIVDAVHHIEAWMAASEPSWLAITGPARSGKSALCRHFQLRAAMAWMKDPDGVVPWISIEKYRRWFNDASMFSPDWLIGIGEVGYSWRFSPLRPTPRLNRFRCIVESIGGALPRSDSPDSDHVVEASLQPLQPAELLRWYRGQLAPALFARFAEAWHSNPDLAEITSKLPFVTRLRDAIRGSNQNLDPSLVWQADIISRFASKLADELETSDRADLERGALEHFALGDSETLTRLAEYWTEYSESPYPFRDLLTDHEAEPEFISPLLRDYFIARHLVAEVRDGNPEILARYQFPQRYVLLYLAVIAPDIAAMISADYSAELRTQIQSDVEHQVQLALAHQLRRAAGALRANFKRILRDPDIASRYAHEAARVHDELDYLSALADRTRKWHEVPTVTRQSIAVDDAVKQVLEPLREHYPAVVVVADIAADIEVSAGLELLRECLHGLLENALQAVVDLVGERNPHVEVRAVYVEPARETVRIDIIDNGPGVAVGDRERIFEPRVSTKKGGNGKPMGTGMGLPIARRYAAAMGGRVAFDGTMDRTCFYIELIAGEPHEQQEHHR